MMKKIVLISFMALGLISLTQEASANTIMDGTRCRAADTFCAKMEAGEELQKALRLRTRRYNYKYRINNGPRKTVHHQKWRHRIGRSLINVDGRSTQLDREGDLEVPYYVKRRSTARNNFRVSNSAKQNWKRAAINYYVEGGDGYTSEEGMTEGVIHLKRDNHRARRFPSSFLTKGAVSRRDIRAAQKLEAQIADNDVNKAPTASPMARSFSNRSGDGRRNLYSPYQRYEVYNPNNYLRTEKFIFGEE